MEHIKAFEALQKKSKKLGFQVLAEHIKNVGPLKIKTSKMDFVAHLVKIIVGQQLSVQSAAAIWKRTELILKEGHRVTTKNILYNIGKKIINSNNDSVFTDKDGLPLNSMLKLFFNCKLDKFFIVFLHLFC